MASATNWTRFGCALVLVFLALLAAAVYAYSCAINEPSMTELIEVRNSSPERIEATIEYHQHGCSVFTDPHVYPLGTQMDSAQPSRP
jgi:hypothetical protein